MHPFPLPPFRTIHMTAGTFYRFDCGCHLHWTPDNWQKPLWCPLHLLEGDAMMRGR